MACLTIGTTVSAEGGQLESRLGTCPPVNTSSFGLRSGCGLLAPTFMPQWGQTVLQLWILTFEQEEASSRWREALWRHPNLGKPWSVNNRTQCLVALLTYVWGSINFMSLLIRCVICTNFWLAEGWLGPATPSRYPRYMGGVGQKFGHTPMDGRGLLSALS